MKYITTIAFAIALLSTYAVRDENTENDLDVEEGTSGIALASVRQGRVAAMGATQSEFLANLRANEARGRSVAGACKDRGPLKESMPDNWTQALDFGAARCLGQGEFGRVFRVEAKCDRKFSLAVKEQSYRHIAKKNNESIEEAKALVRREAEVMANITGQDIVRYHGFFEGNDHGYILMQHLPGELSDTLKEVQVEYAKEWAVADLTVKLALFREALRGVVRVHESGFVHRDLKPSNIFLTGPCNTDECKMGDHHAKVGDFGLACKPIAGVCEGGAGSFSYKAPEVLMNRESSQKSDVWSMGIVLYEVLLGLDKTPIVCSADVEDAFNKLYLKNGYEFQQGWFTLNGAIATDEDRSSKRDLVMRYYIFCATHFDPAKGQIGTLAREARMYNMLPGVMKGERWMRANLYHLLIGMLQSVPESRWTATEALQEFEKALAYLKVQLPVEYAETALPTCMGPLA